jgi:NAD(P)-dependent dehydrogenase (short-subunit alcohol dehydrogenase family)
MKKLAGKVAVITGATSGMGLATAKLFIEEGAYVFITGRKKDQLESAVKEIGANVTGVVADSGNLSDLDRLFETVKAEKGHIDILFASAGIADFAPLGQVTEEHFDSQFNVNAKGTFFTVQKALPLFNDGGSIIMTGTVVAQTGAAYLSVYSASKVVLDAYAKSWVPELGSRNIRVNVIHPGPIETPLFVTIPEEQRATFINQSALRRPGQPQEIASTALFLASSDSGYINGMSIVANGGSLGIQ